MSSAEKKKSEITEDTLFDGKVCCRQHRSGYRFSIDSVLLAHFVRVKPTFRLFDLGCGCGVLPLILLYRHPQLFCSGIELQKPLFTLAVDNIRSAGFADRCSLYHGDIRRIKEVAAAESVDAVVCNPPFYPAGQGRASGGEEEEFARRQVHGKLAAFFSAARYLLKNRGSAAFIYPAERSVDFSVTARAAGMEVKRIRHVHSYPGGRAKLTLFSCMKNGRAEVEIMPPLYVYTEKGGPRSEEVKRFYR